MDFAVILSKIILKTILVGVLILSFGTNTIFHKKAFYALDAVIGISGVDLAFGKSLSLLAFVVIE